MQSISSSYGSFEGHPPREGVDVRVHRVEEYFVHADPRDSRNPLIAAFPPLGEAEVVSLMTNDITFDPKQRKHPSHERISYAMRLVDFFDPLDEQVDFCLRLWALVKHNYRGRSPGRRDRPGFTALMRSIQSGVLPKFADDVVADATMSPVLIGPPGSGKSTSVKAFFRHLNEHLLYHPECDAYQVLAVFVQAPKKGSALALAKQVFDELMKRASAIPGPVPYSTGRRPKVTEDYISAVVVLVERLNLGLLVLDELQHMFNASGALDEEAMKFLTGVINRLGVPILMIGTWQCVALLALETRLARRGTSPADAVFHRVPAGDGWYAFLSLLFHKQYVHEPLTLDDEIAAVFYDLTQGIQDIAVKLFIACQCEAISDGTERITVNLIRRVADQLLTRMAPTLRQIRGGRRDDDPVLWDLDPTDLGDFLKTFAARCASATQRKTSRKASAAFRMNVAVSGAAACIEHMGLAGPEDAAQLALVAADSCEGASSAEIVAKVLKQTIPKGPKPSRSTSEAKQAAVRKSFEDLDPEDFRRVIYLSVADGTRPDSALIAVGHLCPIYEDLAF